MQSRILSLAEAGVLLSMALLGLTSPARATVEISNLDDSVVGASNLGIANTSFYAESFTTGSWADGYLVSSVSLLEIFGNDPGATLTINLASGNHPDLSTGYSLTYQSRVPATGSDSVVTYTPTLTLTLAPSTTYWLTLSTTSINPSSPVAWVAARFNNSYSSNDGWTLGTGNLQNNTGGTWSNTTAFSPMFSVSAAPVPEPSTKFLFLVALGAWWIFRIGGSSGIDRQGASSDGKVPGSM